MRNLIKILLLVLLSVFALSGCLSIIPKTHELSVYLTDAVLPIGVIDRLDVTVSSIVMLSNDSTSLVVSDEATTVNILDLIGTELKLSSVEATGIYDQLRLYVEDATITIGENSYPLPISSGSLKIPLKEFSVGADTSLLLDFDLSNSVKVQGSWDPNNIQNLHMTPVIHVRYVELYNLSGIVENATTTYLVALVPEIVVESTVIPTTFTHMESENWNTGDFRFPKIENGNYELRVFDENTYTATETAFDPTTSIPVAVKPITVNGTDLSGIVIPLS